MLTAFLDESGFDGRSPSYLLAGLLVDQETKASLETAWRATLDKAPHKLSAFKSAPAESLRGTFEEWTEPERDELVDSLARVVRKRVRDPWVDRRDNSAIVVDAIECAAYDRIIKPLADGPTKLRMLGDQSWSNGVLSPFRLLVNGTVEAVLERGCALGERVEFVFDSKQVHDKLVEHEFEHDVHRHLTLQGRAHLIAALVPKPRFLPDQNEPGLQAADLVAFQENRHRKFAAIQGMRRAYHLLHDGMPHIRPPSDVAALQHFADALRREDAKPIDRSKFGQVFGID